MHHRLSALLAFGCVILIASISATATSAQAPEPGNATAATSTLNYDTAKQVMEAAEAEARRNNWNVVIVVTDSEGLPVMVHRLDGAGPRPYDIAMRKAATVVATKMATSAYGEQLKPAL